MAIYALYLNLLLAKRFFASEKVRNGIIRTIFILISVNIKVKKNRFFPYLFYKEKVTIAIL